MADSFMGPPAPAADSSNPLMQLLGGIGNVASGMFVGPQSEAAPLTASEKALRVLLTIMASSQNPAGMLTAHDYYRKQNDSTAGLLASPDFQRLPQAEQQARLTSGYQLPALPITPSEESKLEFNKTHLANETMAEAQKAGNIPDYYRAAGMTPPSGSQGAEVKSVQEGFARAGIEADHFAGGPGGVSVTGEVRSPKKYMSLEEAEQFAREFPDIEGFAPDFTMGKDTKGYYIQGLPPSVRKAQALGEIQAATKSQARREKEAESVGSKVKSTVDILRAMKDLAVPKAFALQKPAGKGQGSLAILNDLINQYGPETEESRPRQAFTNFVTSNLTQLKSMVGQSGNLAVQEIEFLHAGLLGKGLSHQSIHETLDHYITLAEAKAARAAAAAGQPVAAHSEQQPTAKVGGGSTTTGDPDADAILRKRSQKKAK